jgi:hypothetical protein
VMRKIFPMIELSITWEGLKKALLRKVNLLTNGFKKKSSDFGNFDINNSYVYRDTIRRNQNVSTNYQIYLF